jgi:pimeloyl-[acyl-carrier protein] methyl ester esterase
VSLHVEIRGQGPDLVLLHGWALHGGMWGPWLDELERTFRLHLVDLPGHGHSGWPGGSPGLGALARTVFEHAPAGSCVLGWSLGGMIALEMARQYPGHLAALVLVASTPRFVSAPDWPHGMRPDVLDEFAEGLARDHRAVIQNFLVLQTRGDERGLETLRMLRRRLDAHGQPRPEALAAGLAILRHSDLRSALPLITLPTLVIAGEHDRLTPPGAGRAMAASLPSSRFRLVERSGHAPFLSHGKGVSAEVQSFLERRPTAGHSVGLPT